MDTIRADSSASSTRLYLSPREFAAHSGLSLATVHRYLKSGKLPAVQPGGFRARILIPLRSLGERSPELPAPYVATADCVSDSDAVKSDDTTRIPGPPPRWKRMATHRA
jgi:hypothetical protein